MKVIIFLQFIIILFIFVIYIFEYRKFKFKKDWTGVYFSYKVWYHNPVYDTHYCKTKRKYLWRPKSY